ncbi:hypothetical protein HMPREF1981_02642 [Bacteroides pyogenes F0041]|uniref:Uncharacterized protein n=1 Tax=Bacteroides pyogenes F0041 TaxID=1321819 RepID=U2BVB2_9BACE|nr:hypothetical protein HMPREF1981_02642 [Bacteroides pyogenes F0041]
MFFRRFRVRMQRGGGRLLLLMKAGSLSEELMQNVVRQVFAVN